MVIDVNKSQTNYSGMQWVYQKAKEDFITCYDIPRPKTRREMSIEKEINSEKAKLRKANSIISIIPRTLLSQRRQLTKCLFKYY